MNAQRKLPREQPPGGVQVIKRVASILRAVKSAPVGLSVSKLARIVDLPRSTVYRIVRTLADDGFLIIEPGRRGVRLGPELGQLATTARQGLNDVALPIMSKMAWTINETVSLAVWQGNRVRIVDQVVGNQPLRAEGIIGQSHPAYCTANGKAFLAELSPAALKTYFSKVTLSKLTPNTIVGQAKLLKELAEVRATGVAFDREEHELQICAVGTVVHDVLNGASASITIVTPAHRFYGHEDLLAKNLLDCQHRIEELLTLS